MRVSRLYFELRFAQAFAGAGFEENVVGNKDGGAAVLL
jgi:hypothetical protein